ncbi:MAG: hypothetical protein M3458_14870 [Acidobacteriota bacterium]|nr:hypothetical protein [Acidobacteriota bacterium]
MTANSPVANFITAELQSLVTNAARSTDLPERACMRGISEIIRSEHREDKTAAYLFVTRISRARQTGRRYLLFNNEQSIMCLKCYVLSYNPNDAKNLYCASCKVFMRDVVDPDDGRAA